MELDEMIRAVQKSLGVDVDGRPGPQTRACTGEATGAPSSISPTIGGARPGRPI